MKTINSVRFKQQSSFEKTKVKSNVLQVHEPFNIVVFEDETPVEPDFNKVKQTTQMSDLKEIPSGLVTVLTSDYGKAKKYFTDSNILIIESFEATKTFIIDITGSYDTIINLLKFSIFNKLLFNNEKLKLFDFDNLLIISSFSDNVLFNLM